MAMSKTNVQDDSCEKQQSHIDSIHDTSRIISSASSNSSAYEQLRMLRYRFTRLSQERRLLSYLLVLYIIILCALLIAVFLFWVFQERVEVLHGEVTITEAVLDDGVARYGESCDDDNDCQHPFSCFKQQGSLLGICRCPLKYDLVDDRCIGNLNALCTKDSNCQPLMICTGKEDGRRRCECQVQFIYDTDRNRCYGDYHAPCQTDIDCRTNLICSNTTESFECSCPVNYQYDRLSHKCLGDAGTTCDVATTSDECTENAECRDGACECAHQYIPDQNRQCVDPCLRITPHRVRIRYPGQCHRFIDCQQRAKYECPEMTIFNFRTQLCDYPKNVLDCQ